MPEKFVSPLLIGRRTEFNALGFGAVTRTPETGTLQNELNELLFRTITELPPAFQEEAASVVSSYSGGNRNFFGLFYVGSSRVDLQACKLEYSIVSPK